MNDNDSDWHSRVKKHRANVHADSEGHMKIAGRNLAIAAIANMLTLAILISGAVLLIAWAVSGFAN